MALPESRYYTEEEYLAYDLDSEIKNEYAKGEIIAMAGAQPEHNTIVIDTVLHLGSQIPTGTCGIYNGDQRVQIRRKHDNAYRYPDISIVCGEPEFVDTNPRSLTNPVLIMEVLSPSTRTIDYFEKLQEYREIPSLQEYLIVSVSEPRIERYLRQDDKTWILSDIRGIASQLELPSIECVLNFSDIYRRVEFDANDE